MREGISKTRGDVGAIKIRTRPVLMTALAVLLVGMLPVAQGSAIGLERLAPLGAVAIGGLVVGTLSDSSIYSCLVYLVCEGGLNSLAWLDRIICTSFLIYYYSKEVEKLTPQLPLQIILF